MGRVLLLIVGLVVAVGLTGAAQQVQPPQQPASANQPAKAAEKARQQRPPVMITLSEPDRQSERGQKKSHGEAGWSEPSPWYDLWAQSLMALWAFLQLVLTGVGIWYIRKTLVETEKAVNQAVEATGAAQMAVAETTRIGEAQVRAYLLVENPMLSAEAPGFILRLRVINSGMSPARKVSIKIEPFVVMEDGSIVKNGFLFGAAHDIRSGEPFTYAFPLELATPLTVAIGLGNAQLNVRVTVEFEDVFEKPNTVESRFWLTARNNNFVQPVSLTPIPPFVTDWTKFCKGPQTAS